ncbi:sigma-54-dependent transcriptional regulator [Geoalkalibacter halelectricus]|uniref:Sigma-54 dependent transcriptional regulator n=1 Tax=Geoalkalibacter halelectricus TaxID=2847045 RepID=A0ABY5ZL27_9BACT|nr:sigma-54 dependent transcriptional regulator [Geoalkalibacter halelectricus]MDO3376803.1 sigma-54 dependent transcriptional regulator [Geoalkalibacter halelectricus]UWZ79554.1 sigma-54 dependent transcriptional regulator [Geoalkalibacter halelectricus]
MSERPRVLIVDDESAMRHMLRLLLERAGYVVGEAADGRQALERLDQEPCDIVLCDLRMPELGGLDLLAEARRRNLPQTFIMMTAYGSIETALDCMKRGAYDYLSKPFKPDEVVLTLRKAEERLGLQRENQELRRQIEGNNRHDMVYRSVAMAKVVELARRVAPAASAVLIRGETGTGKELVARTLHAQSGRRPERFVALNCGAVPVGLLESELFGHARGAFTGAAQEREGLFAAADQGTLFLDEIAELPLELQPKLLRVLQEGEVRRIGETHSRHVDVRVVAATAADLGEAVAQGRFREDLYYRLNVVELLIPPLRERPEDIRPLAEHFLERIARREGRAVPRIVGECLELLESYAWPGNVRELANFIERTLIFCRAPLIGREDLPWEIRRRSRQSDDGYSLKAATARMEKEYIRKALARTGGNRTHAARLLEISLRALLYKLKDYEIE